MYGALLVIGVGFVLINTNVFSVAVVYALAIALLSSLIMRVAGEFGLFGIGQAGVFTSVVWNI